MSHNSSPISLWRFKPVSRMSAFVLAAIALLFISTGVRAESQCKHVNGHYVEHAVGGPTCASPVGLCIEGTYAGDIRGDFTTTVSSLNPTADTPATAVVLFTADSTIHARIGGKTGDLTIKNAGAFHTAGTGEIVDLQFITGGTGDLAGASGVIRASGTFDPAVGSGESDYYGEICLP